MRIFNKSFGFGKKKKKIPDGLWDKCNKCSSLIFRKILEDNFKVCPKCGYHFPLICWERVDLLADKNTFSEIASNLTSSDPLGFSGPKTYKEKLQHAVKTTGLKEAAVVGEARLKGRRIALGVTDFRFIMGSMGSVLGEKITLLAEKAAEERIPLVISSSSGGGARMYEGMLSLMQMAKTSGAIANLKKENIPYISILAHPTMAGVMASFAGLGDIIVAEPGALIGFAGPRVIKQTIKQDLPEGFQTSEFNYEHGLIDMVVPRKELKDTLFKLIDYLT
ncbi:MAG: acetyl-CoA carboxylase carboxyltransferase subunit beta [Candidatus Omnitrophica bacterium]|nr:acetyl-CoA carboxylase carboxyltransferase subunit beta [Candidatus Omnitrophota bacterium]MBD3269641.1 acetyl-CoA carboxylase carboxyltransferase subunit beta [Candidatus Omnitrophota bacterium]